MNNGNGCRRGIKSFEHLPKETKGFIREIAENCGLGFTRDGRLHFYLEAEVEQEKLIWFVQVVNALISPKQIEIGFYG